MTHTADTSPTRAVYGEHAAAYHGAGWAPLPLPPRAKKPVPNGYTGSKGAWPSFADVYAWTEDHADGNIALRLPPHVVGVDVDAYDTKAGGLVLAKLEADHGPLPPTWRSTSRDDGTSGIRFYQVPPGLRWPSVLGPGIEVIRHGHRYAVAWPSIHPDTDRPYRWINPEGTPVLHGIPDPDTLPHLPTAWVTHFTGGEMAGEQERAQINELQAIEWLDARQQGGPCRGMASLTIKAIAGMATAGSRHDYALAETNRLIWTAGTGHPGITTALGQLRAAFLAATAGDRDHGDAEAEWGRMVAGAVALAAAAHPATPPVDPCTDPFHGLIKDRSATCALDATAPTGNGSTPSPTSNASPTGESAASAAATSEPSPQPELDRTSWWPRDHDAALDDDNPEPGPEYLIRDDGQALFYPGRVNGIVAPSESGKTWVVLLAAVQAVTAGKRVTILDFEDSHRGITTRLRLLGLTDAQIRADVAYIGPDEPFAPFLPSGRDLAEHLEQWAPDLVILDGFNAAMTLQGLDLMSNKDATTFAQTILKPLANNGACVVYIDHTPKDKENASAGGIGAQAKRAMTTGCALRVEIIKAFGKGQSGKLRLRVDKDRQGDVRGASLPGRDGHWAADVHLDPADEGGLDITVKAPHGVVDGNDDGRPAFRPTALMERVSDFLATMPEGASSRAVREGVKGKDEYKTKALEALVEEGYVAREEVTGRGGPRLLHTLVKPFTEDMDGLIGSGSRSGSQVVPGTTSSGPPRSGSPAPSPYGEREPLSGATGADGTTDENLSGSPRIVERVVGGQRVRFNLDTGEVAEP